MRWSHLRSGPVGRTDDLLDVVAVPRVEREVAERLAVDHLAVARRRARVGLAQQRTVRLNSRERTPFRAPAGRGARPPPAMQVDRAVDVLAP